MKIFIIFVIFFTYVDTMSISKKVFPGLKDYKLGTIAEFLDFDTTKLHRAEADVYVCAEIMKIAFDALSTNFGNFARTIN